MIKVHLLSLVLISSAGIIALTEEANGAKYTAMYVFGDSLSDAGANKYFPGSTATADFLPYGIDFSRGPTGRFCNGKTYVDFLAEMHGLPLLPSYADVSYGGTGFLSGVNYASADAGILNDTGNHFGRIVPLQEQISNLKQTVGMLRKQMQEYEVRKYLAKALVVMNIGANDYLNNYMQPKHYSSSYIYSPQQFSDLLIQLYRQHILEIQGLGLRKFLLAEASLIGCSPMRVSWGECESSSNKLVMMLNTRLKSLVPRLNSEYTGSAFVLVETSGITTHIFNNAEEYGFKVKDQSCCGSSNRGTKPLCFRNSIPCSNRDEYLFWDAAHPSEASNRIAAHFIYNITSWP